MIDCPCTDAKHIRRFRDAQRRIIAANLPAVMKEAFFEPTNGMTGYFGYQKMWGVFAFAAAGKQVCTFALRVCFGSWVD